MQSPKSILITGASSGIGAALARNYAGPGITLSICGRNEERLAEIAKDCREHGATVSAERLDVTDRQACTTWICGRDDAAPLDLVIANAGIAGGTSDSADPDATTRRIFATNIDGVVNSVLPALDRMRRRRHGQIAIMSSPAGFRGFPGAPAYCASKSAVKTWGEALRLRHAGDGVEISVICPGFVESRMTADNPFPMPFLMDADRSARIIRRGLERNRGCIAFPFPTIALARLASILPLSLLGLLMHRTPAKE